MLEALYGSYDEMTMPEAALWLLDVEDMLFGGLYHEEVFTILDTWPVAVNRCSGTTII